MRRPRHVAMSLMTCKLQGVHNEMMRLDIHSIVLLAPSGCTSKIAQELNFRTMMGDAVPGLMCTSSGPKKISSSEQITNASQNTEEQSASFFKRAIALKALRKLCW